MRAYIRVQCTYCHSATICIQICIADIRNLYEWKIQTRVNYFENEKRCANPSKEMFSEMFNIM